MLTELPSLLSFQRLGNLMAYAGCCHELPGVYAEFGVAKGGSLELLSKTFPERKIYGIDSFEGVPAGEAYEYHKEGDFKLSEYDLYNIYTRFSGTNVKLIRGFSPDVFTKIADLQFAFVHIDVDMYSSVSHALDFFFPRLVPHGILLFDDYGFDTTPGAKKAIDEWRRPCRARAEVRLADGRFVGQYIIIK